MTRYAENTSVDSGASRAEIERTLRRYGASSFMSGWDETRALLGFVIQGRQVRFVLPMPDPKAREFTHTPERGLPRTASAAADAYEQAIRQRWRALALVIKAKLEAVEAGIVTLEEEFLAHFVLASGQTVADTMVPRLDEVLAGAPALLPAITAGRTHG